MGKWHSTFGGVTLDLKADNTAEFTVKGGAQDLALTLDANGELSGRGGTFVRQE